MDACPGGLCGEDMSAQMPTWTTLAACKAQLLLSVAHECAFSESLSTFTRLPSNGNGPALTLTLTSATLCGLPCTSKALAFTCNQPGEADLQRQRRERLAAKEERRKAVDAAWD